MFDKHISFWCIVLFCVTVMIIHHILSDTNLIEGQQNNGNVDLKDVSNIKIKMKGPPEFMKELLSKKKDEVPVPAEETLTLNEIPESVDGNVVGDGLSPADPATTLNELPAPVDDNVDGDGLSPADPVPGSVVTTPLDCTHLKNDDKTYNIAKLNECLLHLSNDDIFGSMPEYFEVAPVPTIDRISPYGDVGQTGVGCDNTFNEICGLWGHDRVDVGDMVTEPDTMVSGVSGQMWPNRSHCKVLGDRPYAPAKVNGGGNKQLSRIKCIDDQIV